MNPYRNRHTRPLLNPGGHSYNGNARGYSLIEILMVMAVFSIGILGIMALHISAINSNAKAHRIIKGSTWMGDQLEKLMAMDYRAPELDPGVRTFRTPDGYEVRHAVSAAPIPNVKQVDITITMESSSGRGVTVTYYKADRF